MYSIVFVQHLACDILYSYELPILYVLKPCWYSAELYPVKNSPTSYSKEVL